MSLYADQSIPVDTPDFAYEVIDSFEDGDVSEWTGSTSDFDPTGTYVSEGSLGLEFSAATGTEGGKEIESTSGLPRYPGKGDQFAVDILSNVDAADGDTDNFRPGVMFGMIDVNNYYWMQFYIDSTPAVTVWKNVAGSLSSIGSFTLDEWVANTKYTVVITWDNGCAFGGSEDDITMDVQKSGESIGSLTLNDSDNEAGTGIGHRVTQTIGAGFVHSYDHWRVVA